MREEPDNVEVSATNTLNPMGTSRSQQDAWQNLSVPQDPSALQRPQSSRAALRYCGGSQDVYSVTKSNGVPRQNSISPNNTVYPSTPYSLQPASASQQIPDLSAMMFPSTDPFAYPNQPMTTLQSRQFIKRESPLHPNTFNSGLPTTTDTPYSHVEPQIYREMPAYIMPHDQQGYGLQNITSPMDMSGIGPTATATPMQGGDAVWPQQQELGDSSGMNFDQIFGEDWGGWMNQGYRQ